MHGTAIKLLQAGINCLPAVAAEKRPAAAWKPYQNKKLLIDDVPDVFGQYRGICMICGKISGNLEMIDFDCAGKYFVPWKEKLT
jgi:hypothetical protein